MGIHGNEIADCLAKRGSSLDNGPTNEMLTPKVDQKNQIDIYFQKKWSMAWKSYDQASQNQNMVSKAGL